MWRDAAVFSAGLALSICVMLALDNGVGVVLGQVTTMPPVRNCEVGCSDGTREALFGIKNISICNGSWIGFVGGPTAQNLCASGWHVCTHEDINLTKQINYEEARYNISGCYSWAAAHDFGTCRPCSGNVHEEDMAGVGRDCGTQERVGQPSCITGGRVDICCSGYLTSRGCQFFPDRNTGVVCCADRPDDPCFNETCPNDCCGHGVCDNSYGTCTCDVGWSGDDCCTRCEALACIDCMNNTDICGWCNTSQSCTDLSAPACTDFLIGMPEICPERNFTTPENNTIVIEEEDEIVTISDKRGVVFGSVFGGVALILIILGCVAMYCIFSRDKYQEFWDAGALFSDKDVASNPLYKESVIFGENALYEERPTDNSQ